MCYCWCGYAVCMCTCMYVGSPDTSNHLILAAQAISIDIAQVSKQAGIVGY